MSYEKHLSAHRRIAILRVLETAPGRKANSSILHAALDELGLTATRDQVKAEIAWLGEQGLVTVVVLDSLSVPTLTERGEDVAAGRAVVPGVQRPSARG